ncbi:MAG: TlpA family protein disulfide reductase [Brevefilum sp.]
MGVKTKHWLIDLSIILLIIVMGVFVVLELRQTISFLRPKESTPQDNPGELTSETGMPISESDQLVEETAPTEEKPLSLMDLDGEAVSLSDFAGSPMLVNFWATWCPPCVEEMPLIEDYAERYRGDLVVLAINAGEDEGVVRDFVTRNRLGLRVLLDPTGTASRHFRIYGFPTTLFYDELGTLMATHIGELNATLLDRYLLQIGLGE